MPETNILHIIDTLGVGGAEKVMVGCVNGLPELKHHVIYLGGSDAMKKFLPDSCKVTSLNLRSKFDLMRCVMAVRKYIRKNNIDVVHSHLFMGSLVARLATPKKVKLYTTIHSLASRNYFANSRIARWIEKRVYRPHHNIIAICHEVFDDYNKCIGVKGPYTVLYNYVDDKYYQADYKRAAFKDEFRMVAVGNLKKAKNYMYLLEAFRYMPDSVSLDIYGAGPLEHELQEVITRYSLNVRLCGVRDDIQNVLPKYDAFIMSSVFEGQPISLLEAMACGLPAILSDIPVLREATNNKGVFYDLNNVKDLVNKVEAILSHKVDLDEIARSNFERVKRVAGRDNYMYLLSKLYLASEPSRFKQPRTAFVKTLAPRLHSPS
ncbi:MAG: glycosyltransferase [Chitinophagaceae bacterium]|nr:glycosyltransferase [Chitinophagaceae bacterium]MBL0336052.1 glycosyltransferase [Chitinophagaceae bacterium]